jgi:DNA-binding GntR family transcriptional regulator
VTEPTYRALADELEARIAGLGPGDRVASEHDLVEMHGVSRLTARAALQELESRMLVRRVRGAGTFVARRIDYPLGPLMSSSVSEMVRRGGGEPTCRLVSVRTRRASADVRDALDLDPDDKTVSVTRAMQVDGLPGSYGTTHLPHDLVEGIAEHLGHDVSIIQTLRDAFGLDPVLGWVRAEQVVVPAEVARQLGFDGRPLVWYLEVCSADRRLGRPVGFAQTWLRADVYRVTVEIGQAV